MSLASYVNLTPSPRTGRRWLGWLLLVVTLSLVSACSSVRLVYGHLDWWLDRKLNSYLDLSGTQEDLLDVRVDEFHRWHRQTQLPRYADYFEQLAGQVDEINDNPKMLAEIEQQADVFWQSSAVMLTDLVLPLVLELDEQQIDQLAENIREERQKSLKKWAKAQRKREEKFREQTERWLGDLTPAQQDLIDQHVDSFGFDPKLRDAQRQLWANTFIETLRNKPPGYQQKLRELTLNPQALWPEEYHEMHRKLRTQATELAEQIAASATPEQRQHLKSILQDYASDFRALAGEQS